jgi:acyl-coenzyme A synthetase/AMP-(fatty) acid ligase
LSTAEVETALVEHEAIAETAAVSSTHRIKGESIYCFIVLKDGYTYTDDLERELKLQGECCIISSIFPELSVWKNKLMAVLLSFFT